MNGNTDLGGFVYEDNDDIFPNNQDGGLLYPWLDQQQHIPNPDEFLSIPRGPIVYEGFVPDDEGTNAQQSQTPFHFHDAESLPDASDDGYLSQGDLPVRNDSEEDVDFIESETESLQYVQILILSAVDSY